MAALGAAVLPFVLNVGNNYLFSQVCIYAVIALSLTVLTGWAGQVSLGQFGLVAVGALVAAHLGASFPLPLLLLFAGAVTAVVAVIIGLPALRMPGLFLAVTTLGFAIFMQEAVLATPCWTVPGINKTLCTGLPNPASTLIGRPTLFGLSLHSQRSFAWFSLGVLVLSILAVRVWRDQGVARRLVAVRDNELGAGAMGIPVLRTKLLAFGLSGFMAGYAGACLAFATQRFSTQTFDPTISFIVISMVVIGGLGSIPGAVLGALYLEGLPALFGANATIQFLTSGLGLIAFILYLPGGLGELLNRFGDAVTIGLRTALDRLSPRTPARRWPGHPDPGTAWCHAPSRAARARGGRLVRRPERMAGPARLSVEHLGVTFGGVRAVDDVSFTAEPGAIVGLIGANGSGKTTMLDMVSGLVAPQRGTVRLDGRTWPSTCPRSASGSGWSAPSRTAGSTPSCRARRPAAVRGRQTGGGRALLHVAAALGPAAESAKRAAVDQVIGAFGLERFRHHRTAELSTGTRRVVDLASIMLAEPRLLLLDEPTAGIAQREAEAFIPLLRRLHQVADTTIVLVEHDVRSSSSCAPVWSSWSWGGWSPTGRLTWCAPTRGPWPPTSVPATRRSWPLGRREQRQRGAAHSAGGSP